MCVYIVYACIYKLKLYFNVPSIIQSIGIPRLSFMAMLSFVSFGRGRNFTCASDRSCLVWEDMYFTPTAPLDWRVTYFLEIHTAFSFLDSLLALVLVLLLVVNGRSKRGVASYSAITTTCKVKHIYSREITQYSSTGYIGMAVVVIKCVHKEILIFTFTVHSFGFLATSL